MNKEKSLTDGWIQISDEDFKKITSFVYNTIGIHLTDSKKTLVLGRMQKVLNSRKIKDFSEYYGQLISDRSGEMLSELANSISTNHTFFYREHDHFEFFKDVLLPKIESSLAKQKQKDIRIWSAGCSSGEEPYTLVMQMYEHFKNDYKKYDAGILATDISLKALTTAKTALYDKERIKLLPPHYIKKYFKQLKENEYQVKEEIRREVTYRRFNLMNNSFPFKKKFHAIFCRNVMIYFDLKTRITLINKFWDLLLPGGYLFIGHSETVPRDATKFKFVKPALYIKQMD